MILQIVIFLIGLGLVVKGADWLVDGSSSIARRLGISDFVIGLTIVGMGTSAPEMVVSFIGAIKGNADIAIGNIIGSNIFNVLLILGITAVLCPMTITKLNRRKDIPINILITVLLLGLGMTHKLFGFGTDTLTRFDGALFLVLFAIYLYMSFHYDSPEDDAAEDDAKKISLSLSIVMIAGGLAGLIVGGQMFVDSATKIAKMMGVSDKFIAITILAGGTSMPELATCIVAAAKKKGQLALGNILGSNVFNILLILGGSALIHPLSFAAINLVDAGVLLLSALVIAISIYTFKKNQLDRADGIFLLLMEAGYMAWLIITSKI